MPDTTLIPTAIAPSVHPVDSSPGQIGREFRELLESARLKVAGNARDDATIWLSPKLRARYRIDLFETSFYFSKVLQMPELRFFVGYVVQKMGNARPTIFPRIFYKDLSLAWRSASHFTSEESGIWVGKGDVREVIQDGHEMIVSDESTTDLPLEMQTAIDGLLDFVKRPANGEGVLELVLRQAPPDRVEPYRDFVLPRLKAASNRKNLVNGGRAIAKFLKANDPGSLRFVDGYEPDFGHGILEQSQSRSKLYGGKLCRFRILSTNRKIQYYFFAGERHVWLVPPQALTTELSSYGVRTIDVNADEDLFIPGYEYHHYEETSRGLELYSQIPEGFVGEICPVDDAKADASPWLDKLPVVQEFRNQVLAKN